MQTESYDIFKVLSVNTRVKIINLLKTKGSLGAKNIAEILNITVAVVSQHLKILKQVGLVTSERKGYHIPYILNKDALENCKILVSDVCSCGCKKSVEYNDLDVLKKYEKELKCELKNIRKKINEIESSKD